MVFKGLGAKAAGLLVRAVGKIRVRLWRGIEEKGVRRFGVTELSGGAGV
jgi:hypothetical protein